MTPHELLRGYNWLIRALYSYDSYRQRLSTVLRQWKARPDEGRAAGAVDLKLLGILMKSLRYFLLTRSSRRRRFFLATIREVIASGATMEKIAAAVSYLIAHKHFHEYVTGTHGDPEAVPAISPFAESVAGQEWWQGQFDSERMRQLKREVRGGWLAWLRPPVRRAVAVPEAFLSEKVGECLRRYLNELDVDVVPVAAAAMSRMRDSADVLVLPILGSVRKGREELYQIVQQLHERVQADLERVPRIVHLALDGDHRAVVDGFARVGLNFTRRIERLREAYAKAVEAVILSQPAPGEPIKAS
jgi:hypothetical protein